VLVWRLGYLVEEHRAAKKTLLVLSKVQSF
jgi:hypothetical protein